MNRFHTTGTTVTKEHDEIIVNRCEPLRPSCEDGPQGRGYSASPFFLQKRAMTNELDEARREAWARAIVMAVVIGLLIAGILFVSWGKFVRL